MRIPKVAFALAVPLLLLIMSCGTTKNPISSSTGRPDTSQNDTTIVGGLDPEDFTFGDSTWFDSSYNPPIITPPDTGYGVIYDPPAGP
ncbi:hypothetical protein KQH82_10010 [bacterium]|nr:hypothetical protein [bacterium]